MGVVKTDPARLPGPWKEGYVLERQHTIKCDFLGHDSFGIPQFDTERSALGELVFRLKYRNDKTALDSIAETAVQFLQGWNPPCDIIVPVPPSRQRAGPEPVVEIATAVGVRIAKPVSTAALRKSRSTPELKNVFDYAERIALLSDVFQVNREAVRAQRILLVDDLFRSGATATLVTRQLLTGGAAAVYMFAMTKTRTRT
jgi:competence protein ComFC